LGFLIDFLLYFKPQFITFIQKLISMKKTTLGIIVIFFTFFTACNTDDSSTVPKDLKINDFVWKGLNLYYLWQEEVPNLADDRFTSQSQLNDFLRGYSNPSDLFNSLLYQKGTVDRFSVIYSDYTVLEQVLTGNN